VSPAPSLPVTSPAVRESILAAAKTEFSAHGRKGASVRAIGRRAGVTAAMINYYFGGKDALYEAVVSDALGRQVERLAQALTGSGEGGLAARLAGAYFDFLAEEGEIQRLLAREVLDQEEGVPGRTLDYLAPLRAAVESRHDVDADDVEMAISLFGAIAGYFLYAPVLADFLGEDPRSEDRLARRRRHITRLAAFLYPER
jgi:AcrR family transcriptional regulator